MPDFLTNLYSLRDDIANFWQHPALFQDFLASHHKTVILIVGIIVTAVLFLIVFLKADPKKALQADEIRAEPKMPVSPVLHGYRIPVTVEKMKKKEAHFVIKAEHTPQLSSNREPAIQELSLEEEQALNQAMLLAGKQALAEFVGEPRQTEFFHNDDAALAAKKMFARQKEAEEPIEIFFEDPANAAKPAVRNDFVMLYFMAPRSHVFGGERLFKLCEEFGLHLNEDRVFEHTDEEGLHFYIASAVKPGHFEVGNFNFSTPGLSFVIDLMNVRDGKNSFHKMLKCIDHFSHALKGDLLDDQHQRLNQNTISVYLARIRSFVSLQHSTK